jgi:hypothetical protein
VPGDTHEPGRQHDDRYELPAVFDMADEEQLGARAKAASRKGEQQESAKGGQPLTVRGSGAGAGHDSDDVA